MDVMGFASEKNAAIADVRFTDLWGTWHHISVPINLLEDSIKEGIGFDGSSIRGFQEIEASDMVLKVDSDAPFFMDPFTEHPTLVLIANSFSPDGKEYDKDPRIVSLRTEKFLAKSGIADTAYIGPEAEFFIFNNVEFAEKDGKPILKVYSDEFDLEGPNHGHAQKKKAAYFPVAPDRLQDIRTAIVLKLQQAGIEVEAHHHEVARAQCEIDLKYQPLTKMADYMQIYKYFVIKEAMMRKMTATFMEKPVQDDNGSGMHVHQSLWKDNKPLFAGNGYAGLSKEAFWYIGGLNKYTPALTPIFSQNYFAYLRFMPGFEAPNIASGFSAANRSAPIRIPVYFSSPGSKRIEFRPPGPTCNPYLAFSAMLLAGLDGIKNKIEPGEHTEGNFYKLNGNRLKIPSSLEEALKELEKNKSFLTDSGVWSHQLLDTFFTEKRKEIEFAQKNPLEALRRCYSYGI